jgi:hypothetical protein
MVGIDEHQTGRLLKQARHVGDAAEFLVEGLAIGKRVSESSPTSRRASSRTRPRAAIRSPSSVTCETWRRFRSSKMTPMLCATDIASRFNSSVEGDLAARSSRASCAFTWTLASPSPVSAWFKPCTKAHTVCLRSCSVLVMYPSSFWRRLVT